MNNPLLYAAMAEWFKAVDLKSIKTEASHAFNIGSIPVRVIF